MRHTDDLLMLRRSAISTAPTPSAAAERAVPVRADLLAELASLNARQARGVARFFDERRTRLRSAARALPRPDEFLALVRQRFDTVAARLPQALRANVQHHRVDLAKISGRLSVRPIAQNQQELKRRLAEANLRGNRAVARALLEAPERDTVGGATSVVRPASPKDVAVRQRSMLKRRSWLRPRRASP